MADGASDAVGKDKSGERTQHRKPHQKSRMGCAQCKARRVKCDERFPSCSNCRRRREQCSYNGVAAAGTPDDSESSAAVAAMQQVHMSQLELMHQYCTSTYATFVTLPRDRDLALVEIPRMAISHDYLRDALFTLTSLHLADQRPEVSSQLIDEALRYQTRALATCRQSLSNLSDDAGQCRAMFHCSAILGICAMGLHSVRSKTGEQPKPSETLREAANLWRGTGLMLSTAHKLLDPETFKRFFPLPDWYTMVVSTPSTSPAHAYLEKLRFKIRSLEPRVVVPSPGSPHSPMEESRVEAYQVVIDKLQKLFQIGKPETAAILNILIEVSSTFIDDLVEGRPLASILGLFYTVLLHELHDHWWSTDYDQQLMNELLPHIPMEDPDLVEMAKWIQSTSPQEEPEDSPHSTR